MSGDASNPFDRVVEPWEEVIEDTEELAAEYREADWTVLELHPGDVATLGGDSDDSEDDSDDRFGIEVLAPDPEFDRLTSWIDDGTEFDSYQVYRTVDSGLVFLLVVFTDEATERVVCIPAYYERSDTRALRERAEREGLFFVYVCRLRRDRVVTFTGDDPTLFVPE